MSYMNESRRGGTTDFDVVKSMQTCTCGQWFGSWFAFGSEVLTVIRATFVVDFRL